ncbi:MAG: Sec-independent protein translocase subunit TatA/TatB [Isosphaeraceae bacterium]
MGTVGISGVVILLVLALLFFGAKRLPALARSARVGAKEFKDSASGVSGLSSTVPAEPAPLPPPDPSRAD